MNNNLVIWEGATEPMKINNFKWLDFFVFKDFNSVPKVCSARGRFIFLEMAF